MIKKMRLKFFTVTSAIVVAMILIFCGTIIITTKIRNNSEAKSSLNRIIGMFEVIPDETGETVKLQMNDIRSFAVILDSDNNIIKKPNVSYYTEQEVDNYITEILNGNTPTHFLITKKSLPSGEILVAWIDRSVEIKELNSLTLTVSLIGASSIFVLVVLVWFLSFWIVKPARTSLDRQKRFISEASHELKTPLTIISAGVELLQKQKGNNTDTKKWLGDIKRQSEKMSDMTAALLSLSKLDETNTAIKTEFDLSQTILKEVLSFESVAYEQGKEFLHEITESIIYKGNANAVMQAVAILCDNAIKHSGDKAIINVTLKKQNGKNVLTVANTGSKINNDEIPFLFDRFYRGSEARSETQGTGLGLAILKLLAEQNNWKCDVKVENEKTIFTINL